MHILKMFSKFFLSSDTLKVRLIEKLTVTKFYKIVEFLRIKQESWFREAWVISSKNDLETINLIRKKKASNSNFWNKDVYIELKLNSKIAFKI